MPQVSTARLCRRRRRSSQPAIAGFDHDIELKSIYCEPTTEEEEEEEEEEEVEEEEEDEEEEEEEDEDEEEFAPESSMEEQEEDFDQHRENWEISFGKGRFDFEALTMLSPMLFTHCSPSRIPEEAILSKTLQIYSIKIAKTKHLKWPLQVYGVVAARDYVDHRRNIVFFRRRIHSQTLTKKDPYLHLTGPCRALMCRDPVHIEFQLKVKGQSRSQDRTLITRPVQMYNPSWHDWCYRCFSNYLCKIELCFEQLGWSRQATILSARVTQGSPFKHGGQIVCRASPCEDDPNKEIVLYDSKYGTMDMMEPDVTMSIDSDGYLQLSRRVVSVRGRLKFFIYTYSRAGAIAASGRVLFKAKDCQTSQATCILHNNKPSKGKNTSSKVKITVAWSRLVRSINDIGPQSFDNRLLLGYKDI
ncbi:uncharacterized protein LOC123425105 [Hordeum vulgare subsp. vulgare]|uniref:DUF6598 domain-containing protein n=1 Tax=Hordeum vulgare subsp. vulgare TaxID=112509 RepID=A0A8I6WNA4_HORVV|nr:uncharacterized protein LOC123425105 [Hordeum vulgare subsp. vulgare]